MTARPRLLRAARAAAVCVGTLLMLVGALSGIVNREVLDGDRFAAHVDEIRTDPDVARYLGSLLTDRLLAEEPDLVAIRPLVEGTATEVVGSATLSPVVRGALAPLHDTLVVGDPDPTVLHLADVAAVVVGVLSTVAPEVTATVPADLDVQLSEFAGGAYSTGLVEQAHRVRLLAWLAPLLGLLLLAGAGAMLGTVPARSRESRVRGALRDVGAGVLGAGALLAVVLVVLGAVVRRADTGTLSGAIAHAGWAEVAGTAWTVALVVVGLGAAVLLGGREEVRADPRGRLRLPRSDAGAALRALVLVLAGTALALDPGRVLLALGRLAGVALVLTGLAVLHRGALLEVVDELNGLATD